MQTEASSRSANGSQVGLPRHGVVLGKHDLSAVVNELSNVASKWMLVATCLEVDQADITDIESQRLSPRESLLKVVSKWLDTANDSAPPTWHRLVDALRQPVLNEERVAKQIEKKVCSTFRSRTVSSPPEATDSFRLRVRKVSRSESTPESVEDIVDKSDVSTRSAISVQVGVSFEPLSSSSSSSQSPLLLSSINTPTTSEARTNAENNATHHTCGHSPDNTGHIQAELPGTSVSTASVQTQTTGSLNSTERKCARDDVDVSSFVQSCLSSLPKITKADPSSSFLDSLPSSKQPCSTPLEKTCSSSSPKSIKLECEVFNGTSGRQIQCTSVTQRETRELYRDIKLKVKKFDTVPPCTPIFLRVRASEACNVYIINKGSSGSLSTLIPNECDKNNRLSNPDEFIQFPSTGADYEFELDQNCGTEMIIVLAYSSALGDPAQAERDCKDILNLEKKELLRDVKLVKKPPRPCVCRGCIEVQFTVK